MNDQFFNFWFRFVYPNLSDLEIGLVDEVFSRISRDLNAYYGLSFENLIVEEMKLKRIPPLYLSEIRKWWHKDREIDIVALNEDTNEILFCECKWRDEVDAGKILYELKEKSKFVKWHDDKRKESYAIFAKSFREKIREPDLLMFDLNDMEIFLK